MGIVYDKLTRTWDRMSCIEYIAVQLKKRINVAVVLIDLDNFTNIDKKVGWEEGNKVLQNIAKYLTDNADDGIVGRYGGDEFVIIYKNSKQQEISYIINQLHKNFRNQRFLTPESPYAKVPITISTGIAFSSNITNGSFQILKQAETALARAKKKGRNRVEIAEDSKIRILKNYARVSTVVGGGLKGDSEDGKRPFKAGICEPYGVDVFANGELLLVDRGNHKIRRLDNQGILRTVAGTGMCGYSGDNGPAAKAMLCKPSGVAIGPDGCLYIADTGNHCIRKVNNEGIITTFAGCGEDGCEGDEGKAVTAKLSRPGGVVVDDHGCVYTNDYGNNVVRMITADGIIRTVAGSGEFGYSGDGKSAVMAAMDRPYGIAVNQEGSVLFIADYGNHCIREVNLENGTITTLCGTGEAGYSGDGGDCSKARLNGPFWVCMWGQKHLLVADGNNNSIRVINLVSRRITTLAGNAEPGYRDVEEGACDAGFNTPAGMAVDSEKEFLYVADYANNAIRRVVLKNIVL